MSGSEPKLHHYVPQFHLRRFANSDGQIWAWNKHTDAIFPTSPAGIAAEKHFYRMTDLAEQGHDPLTMEKQLSQIEGDTSLITDQWLGWLRECRPGDKIPIPKVNRGIVAQYVALQFLRTADTREILSALIERPEGGAKPSEDEQRRVHTSMLWDLALVKSLSEQIRKSIWIFGRNETSTPFLTSDNPVTFKTSDNKMWLKVGVVSPDTYVTFPMASDIVMYCYQKRGPYAKLGKFNNALSPVKFTKQLVESDNSGQVFMAGRFVISPTNDFEFAREFLKYEQSQGGSALESWIAGNHRS
jgi:Protein of unknown function (DUF4238)